MVYIEPKDKCSPAHSILSHEGLLSLLSLIAHSSLKSRSLCINKLETIKRSFEEPFCIVASVHLAKCTLNIEHHTLGVILHAHCIHDVFSYALSWCYCFVFIIRYNLVKLVGISVPFVKLLCAWNIVSAPLHSYHNILVWWGLSLTISPWKTMHLIVELCIGSREYLLKPKTSISREVLVDTSM